MRLSIKWALLLPAAFLMPGCKSEKKAEKQFIDFSAIDSSVRPGDDFFEFVNGKWYGTAQIPATEIGTGSFFDLTIHSLEALRTVCEEAASKSANAAKGSLEQLVGDLYRSVMDSAAAETKGYSPLNPVFQKIDALGNTTDLIKLVAAERINGNGYLFGFGIGPDEKNASVNVANFGQGGLGLPDRDFYFRNDEGSRRIREAYLQYLTKIFALTGSDSAQAATSARKVLEVETKLAEGHFTNVDLRIPEKNYNKIAVKDLAGLTPGFDWDLLLPGLLVKSDSIVVGQLPFFRRLGGLLPAIPMPDWKVYLRAVSITNSAGSLNQAIGDAYFEFYNKTLYGQQEKKPRWQYAVTVIDGRIGDLSGQLYARKYFDERAKQKMMKMIDNLEAAYETRIRSLDWMSDSTKAEAIAKLHTITRKIGYPDKWKTYDTLVITADDYFQNRINTSRYEYMRNIVKNGQPVDKSEWAFTPPTVNAFYNPTTNEIMFLAGILQPPFFHPDADDAVNYGAIGMVIGHELTHGFDDQGRQYDKDGNLRNWWTAGDAEKFTERAKQVGAQYASYLVIDSLYINPDLTMGENLADLGGVAIAYDAYLLTEERKAGKPIDDLTPDQRFFISYASIWRIKMKDELMRQILLTDVHSPAKYRVNGPLTNFTPFYEAFQLKPGDKMWKEEKDRIRVW